MTVDSGVCGGLQLFLIAGMQAGNLPLENIQQVLNGIRVWRVGRPRKNISNTMVSKPRQVQAVILHYGQVPGAVGTQNLHHQISVQLWNHIVFQDLLID